MKRDEDIFQDKVFDLIKMRGLHVAHFPRSKNPRGKWQTAVKADAGGYPDLTICGPGGVIWRELKTETGTARPTQRIWLIWLQQAGQDAGIWRPADLTSGLIDATLLQLARPKPWPTITDLKETAMRQQPPVEGPKPRPIDPTAPPKPRVDGAL